MRKNKQFVSFLTNSRPSYTFTKTSTYRLIDNVRLHTEKLLTSHFVKHHLKQLQTPLFEYTVGDQYKTWTQSIVKRFDQFVSLRKELKLRYADVLLPIPVKNVDKMEDAELPAILDFFQHFMNSLSQSDAVDQDSFLSFVGGVVGHQLKQIKVFYQGVLGKRAGGRHNEGTLKKLFNFLTSWEDRLVSITPEGIYLCEEDSLGIEDSLMFSSTFTVLYGEAATSSDYGVVINSSQRILSLDARNIFNLCLFVRFLNEALKISEATSAHRYTSFAPLRFGCDAKYYIDGEGYFDNVCEALLSAKREVFITGWMLSPFFSLRRPDFKAEYRLDNVLARVANAGIKVSIIIYNAPKMALNIDSQFTQTYLTKLSPNIKVILHPNYVLIPFLWSHHQKMVVVDQQIAFMGGLDIGYGRFDSKCHLLSNAKEDIWPGVDFCNYRVADIILPQEYNLCSIDKKINPRMPWHDIAVRLMGASVQDLCRHFIQYWNYVNFQMDMDDRQLLMYVGIGQQSIENAERDEETRKKQSREVINHRQSIRLSHTDDTEDESLFNLLNFFKKKNDKKINHSDSFQLPFELETQPVKYRSSVLICQTDTEASEVELQKEKEFYVAHLQQEKSKFKSFMDMLNPKSIINHRMGTSFEEVTLDWGSDHPVKPEKKSVQHQQILRSAAMWSIGLEEDKPEHSIWNAYLHLIENAKEFIYIQNQFFISEHNGVAQAIANRIIKAHKDKERFRVVIMIPALPGFDGHPADQNAAVFRVQLNLILKTVRQMYNQLLQGLGSPYLIEEYIFMFSLRTHSLIQSIPVTEIIYIHSKVMIVDDRVALIGSANINDRSLKGTRDTELAVIIEDEAMIEISIGEDEKREVAIFAHQLRKQLYVQHFGITAKQAEDYHEGNSWSYMLETAKKNHDVYRVLFGCYPDNAMNSFEEIEIVQQRAKHEQYNILHLGIKSNAIPFQREFLVDEDLSLRPGQKEYFLPDVNFT